MEKALKRIVIVGATSKIAEHVARIWVTEGDYVIMLIGRDLTSLESIAADLTVRGRPQTKVEVISTTFTSPENIKILVDNVASGGTPDIVLIAHGSLPDQALCETDLVVLANTLLVNGTSVCLLAEGFAGLMQGRGTGQIAVFGSVAGDRGRKSNYAYGAAKGLVETYLQGMEHRFGRSEIIISLIKPGPTATPMTANLAATGIKMANVEAVAANIVLGLSKRRPVIYVPFKWALIMAVIRILPRFIFNRMQI